MAQPRSRIELAPAYVLHHAPWRDSSRIYEVLTRDHGRLSLFARGVRSPKSRLNGLLQPFVPLLVSFSLRGEAGTLMTAEQAPVGDLPPLPPAQALSGFYLSELVMKLTIRHDAQADIYDHYHRALLALRGGAVAARELRLFEKRLLDSLGYGLQSLAAESLDSDAELEAAKVVLRQALTACLEGRALKTRRVAEEMRDMRRAE
jgi:DNA repair protein RecO (recombination protein O)